MPLVFDRQLEFLIERNKRHSFLGHIDDGWGAVHNNRKVEEVNCGADEKQQAGAFHGAQDRPVRFAGQACGEWRDGQRPFDKLMVTAGIMW